MTLSKTGVDPLSVHLAKVAFILVFFCLFAECAAGSCLSYGHACWGAHGKRSGIPNGPYKLPHRKNIEIPNANSNSKWFLAKLIQSPWNNFETAKYLRTNEIDRPSDMRPSEKQFYNDIEMSSLDEEKGSNDWSNNFQENGASDDYLAYDDLKKHFNTRDTKKTMEKRAVSSKN